MSDMQNSDNGGMGDMEAAIDREIGDILAGAKVPVLDHGFVRFIDKMGSDAAIVQAARVSYGKGTKTPSEDQQLISRLMRCGHTTPFEMCEVKFHVKLPIFLARQWIRHRTWNYNEYSMRYSKVIDDMYMPEPDRVQAQSTSDKQGSGDALSPRDVDGWLNATKNTQAISRDVLDMGDKFNVARELNRINLPVSGYTEWYCKVDLHNLFHFLELRLDPHAQWEMQQYAKVLLAIVAELFPMAVSAFIEHRVNSVKLSWKEQAMLGAMLQGTPTFLFHKDDEGGVPVEAKKYGFSKGECDEFLKKILTMHEAAKETAHETD